MGRNQNIDRNSVLDAAEHIVLTEGAAELSMDAVARAAGITKGGVQYCFGSKKGMVDAMVARWSLQFQQEIDDRTSPTPDPISAIRGYVEATAEINKQSHARAAGLMAMLLQSPKHMEAARSWYHEHLQPLDLSTAEGRRARIAFMAMEGAFVLRSFGFMHMEEDEWQELYSEILDVLPPADHAPRSRRDTVTHAVKKTLKKTGASKKKAVKNSAEKAARKNNKQAASH